MTKTTKRDWKVWTPEQFRIHTFLECAKEALKHKEPFSAQLFIQYAEANFEALEIISTTGDKGKRTE